MSQANFFDAKDVPALDAGQPESAPRRVFVYDGQHFDDPGPQYSISDVLQFLAATYPDLERGTWTSRTLADGREEITFVKVAGEKGSLTPPDLIAALRRVPPVRLQATDLLPRLFEAGELSAAHLLELGPAIEAALVQAETLSQTSQKVSRRCAALRPIPQSQTPLGF